MPTLGNPTGSLMGGGIYYRFPPAHAFHGLKLLTPPIVEPLTLAECKAQCRIPSSMTSEDALLLGYIATARECCENETLLAMRPQTWRLSLLGWPRINFIQIPLGPFIDVVSFEYTDTSMTTRTMVEGTDYLIDNEQAQARIVLPWAHIWPPVIMSTAAPIVLTFRVGYPAFASVVRVNDSSPVTGYGTSVFWVSGDLFDATMNNGVVAVTSAQGSPASDATQSAAVDSVVSATAMTLASALPATTSGALVYDRLPSELRQAMRWFVSQLYEHREPVVLGRGEVPAELLLGFQRLLGHSRIHRF